jgi:transposase
MSLADATPRTTRSPAPRIKLDANTLHALAAGEKDRHAAKRIRALAYFAEGKSSLDVAVRVNSNMETVLGWRRKFRAGGLDALRVPRRGARSRLTPRQRDQLAAIIRERPEISCAELCAIVKKRFNVTYKEPGLAAYVRREFGFMRHAGRFWGLRPA